MSTKNCYTPGYELVFAKQSCDSNVCKKTYDPICMYDTQGQYVCRRETKNIFNDGMDNILNSQEYIVYKSK